MRDRIANLTKRIKTLESYVKTLKESNRSIAGRVARLEDAHLDRTDKGHVQKKLLRMSKASAAAKAASNA